MEPSCSLFLESVHTEFTMKFLLVCAVMAMCLFMGRAQSFTFSQDVGMDDEGMSPWSSRSSLHQTFQKRAVSGSSYKGPKVVHSGIPT